MTLDSSSNSVADAGAISPQGAHFTVLSEARTRLPSGLRASRSATPKTPKPPKTHLRSVDSFALVQGPKGCGLVVDDLGVGVPMGAWLEVDAIVVAGQAGLVRIKIGREARNAHWPDTDLSSKRQTKDQMAAASTLLGGDAGSIDLMEVISWPNSAGPVGDSAPCGHRRLWRLPLLKPANTLAFGTGSI